MTTQYPDVRSPVRPLSMHVAPAFPIVGILLICSYLFLYLVRKRPIPAC